MELFASFLPFLKVLGAFGLMLIGMRYKIGLAVSILLGGIVMGATFGLGARAMAVSSVMALGGEKFLFLLAIVGLIMILSDGLERSGQSRRLMEAISGYLTNPRLRLIFFPALIGLLPMPGGAIFSAPMVKAMGDELSLKGEDQAVINYWFRHVWEPCWPLYPGIILTVALANIPIFDLISKTWPGTLALLGFGWIFLLRNLELRGAGGLRLPHAGNKVVPVVVLREGLPLVIAIAGAVGCETLLARFTPGVAFEWGVIAALFLSVLTVAIQNRMGRSFLWLVLTKKALWQMLLVVAAIFIFKDIMQAAGIVEELATAAGGGVALFAAACLLPFLVGMIAGINVAFVGATFPLLLGLLHNLGLDAQVIPYLVLATFAGFTGVMVSPIHICFVLTCNYFNADVARSWRRLPLPALGFLATGTVLFFFYLIK